LRFGSPATGSSEENRLDILTVKSEEVLILLRRVTVSLAGVATSTDHDQIIQNVIDLQNMVNAISRNTASQTIANDVRFNEISKIDLLTLPSIQSLPWVPDLLSTYVSYVRFHVLKDIIHATAPILGILLTGVEVNVNAIEQKLNYLYFEETANFLPYKKERYSQEEFIRRGLSLHYWARSRRPGKYSVCS
jgi:hypothetical protein